MKVYLSCLLFLLIGAQAIGVEYNDRAELQQFVRELVVEHGFDESSLYGIFDQAVYKQTVIDAISRPAEKALQWKEYRKIFLTDSRIRDGVKFWQSNRATLARAEEKYGVPAAVVAAVIGVETLYGKRMGNYRVLDSLTTLAFDYPPRGVFFRSQLTEFLLLVREGNHDITKLMGSYAGAMGYGQFIPSSYRDFAIDFDDDGIRDIWSNPVDAIGSVANYLQQHGWRKGEPISSRARVSGNEFSHLFNKDLKPSMTLKELTMKGVVPVERYDGLLEATPIKLTGEHGSEYWLGLYNFYVITRYNHSKLYAMAVYQLSTELALQKAVSRMSTSRKTTSKKDVVNRAGSP